MKALPLLLALAAPAAAQNLRATLAVPGAPTLRLSPVIPTAPRLAAPALALPLPAPSLTPTLAQPAPIAIPSVQHAQAAAQPALQALAAPAPSAASAHSAGVTLENALTGAFSAPVTAVNGALPSARSAPAVAGVRYARGVTKRQRAVLDESLRRRKAGWFRGLSNLGVALDGPVAPALKVVKAEDKPAGTAFDVQWTQGPTRAGAFRVTVPSKDPAPEFRRLAEPAVPETKLIIVRFQQASEAEIRAFLESRGLRLVSRGWSDQPWTVAVTGRQRASAVARALNGTGLVLSATAKTAAFPESDQLLVAFVGRVAAPAWAAVFKRHGLSVLEKSQSGLWRVGVAPGKSAKALAALAHDGYVLYARPVTLDIPESRQAVITLRETVMVGSDLDVAHKVIDEDVSALLRRHGLTVVAALGGRTYKVAGETGALASDPFVESVVAVGALGDAEVEAAARGAASYKGRPWSATEYNMNWSMTYDSLVRRGATAAQLARYERLTAEAPMRGGGFNPWSGD